MVRVSGDLVLVTSRPLGVVSCVVRARSPRTRGGGLVVDFTDSVEVRDGWVGFECLPGPAVLIISEADSSQAVVPLLVPDHDATLAECVDAAENADVHTRRELEEWVWEIRDSQPVFEAIADRTVEAAGRAHVSEEAAGVSAAAASRSEGAAGVSERNAKTSEVNASGSASAAAGSEQRAKASEDKARGSETRAAASEKAASTSAGEAASSAGSASRSASAAAQSAKEAGESQAQASRSAGEAGASATSSSQSEQFAADHARQAESSAGAAGVSETNAAEHASKAAGHEVAAQGHAQDAQASAERAATIAGSTRWVGTQLEVNGKLSPELTPTIGANGNWVVGGKDSGKPSRGQPGNRGDQGERGEPGIHIGPTPPENKDILWLDTSDTPLLMAVVDDLPARPDPNVMYFVRKGA